MILAIGNSGIHEVEAFQSVVTALQSRGVNKVVLFRQDKCLESDFLVYQANATGVRYDVVIDSTPYCIDDFTGIWYLKPHLPKELLLLEPGEYRQMVNRQFQEMRHALRTLFRDKKWVNDPWAEAIAENKLLQLKVATDLGFSIPPTLVTSDPDRVRAFFYQQSGGVIMKLLAPAMIMNNVMYTNRLSEEALAGIDRIKQAPAIFQGYVEKAYELRITVVGDKIFAAKIDSQVDPETAVDWRRKPRLNDTDLKMSSVTLPSDVEARLFKLVAKLGLRFGCIDMIVSPSGDYIFLEINPNGQWYFVQLRTQARIAEAIADLLV
ncbi:MAG: hypothetical protein QY311_01665 [Candidatus Paceibacterota bacterium]|nr:MAG: hypothetical protein QY311_01665 [Candidatus Paceibacterota bacterium]